MLIDASFSFLPWGSSPQSMVLGAGVSAQIGTVLDLMGVGVGVAPPNVIGTTSVFGMQPGTGVIKPVIQALVGTSFATSNSATLNVQLQYAADTGASGGYQPSTWNTIVETGTISAANLIAPTAGNPFAAVFAQLEFDPTFPFTVRPRFVRLYGVIPASTNFTAGTVAYAGVMLGRDEFTMKQAARNFAVS